MTDHREASVGDAVLSDAIPNRYEVLRPLGRGGMASTYLVRDLARGGEVALKLLTERSPSMIEAFRLEFARLASVHHPNLARVHDFAAARRGAGGLWFYTADYVDGVAFDQYASGRSWDELVAAVVQTVSALGLLHEAGLRHGDVKPSNVLVDGRGRATLIDLGCARPIGVESSGTVSGTPGYIAPELLSSGPVDGRADLFSLGVVLRTVLDGHDELPLQVRRLVERMTSPSPAERPGDVSEVLDLLGMGEGLAAVPVVLTSSLLGREASLSQAHSVLDALWSGAAGARVAWVSGPPGVGRSRLLQEIKWTAQVEGTVVEGFADEPSAVTAMLRRVTNDPHLPEGIDGVLRAREAICAGAEPVVLAIDDAHQLSVGQQMLLDALLRSLEPQDPLVVLGTSVEPPSSLPATAEVIVLAPLGEDDVGQWAASLVAPRDVPGLVEVTGGFPALVDGVLRDVASGRMAAADIAELADLDALAERQRLRAVKLPEAARRALALFALCKGELHGAELERLAIERAHLEALHEEGWLVPDRGGWKLARSADAASITAAFDGELLSVLRREVAASIRVELDAAPPDEHARSELWALYVAHLAEADALPEAKRALDDHRALAPLAPQAWCRAVAAVATRGGDPDLVILQASLHGEAGDPDKGLRLLEPLVSSRADGSWQLAARLEAARSALKLGDTKRCLDHVVRAMPYAESAEERAAVLDLHARAAIQRGDGRLALERASEGLDTAPSTATVLRAALIEDRGVALSYLGEIDGARAALREAEALQLAGAWTPRDRVRLYSYQAINEYRAGNTSGAIDAYDRALEVAEAHQLQDHIATAALNLGTACHQAGSWGRALACYRRGLAIARALDARSTRVILQFNLAQLYGDIGALDRAATLLDQVDGLVASEGPSSLAGAVASLRAELLALNGDVDGARQWLDEARAVYESHDAGRELAEVALQRAALDLMTGDRSASRASLAHAEQLAREAEADDLVGRVAALKGRSLLLDGEGGEALDVLEQARERARAASQLAHEAEVESMLAEAARTRGGPALARRHETSSREIWERIAATLPDALRDAFWRHPRRQNAGPRDEGERHRAPSDTLLKLLEINRRLSSSLKMDDVLRHAMDAAVELTGAERGFLILWRPDGRGGRALHVPVARNLDREKIDKSQLKYSRTIAEQVIETGEPLVTVDALSDERFKTHASIHAMRLRSVISVPVRSPQGVMGALYLDNRFQRGRFREEDMGVLLAFADQVAIALINAQLVADLEERTRQLEEERARIESMVESQAAEIDRLNEEVRTRATAPVSYRHDYSRFIGRSPAMTEVLSIVDRVTDAPFPVLIQGESGTGKELVARAIHDNGPRAREPFVTVNCAALPEPLLESELFGHVRGAFTGAVRDRAGLFVEARGGTLFLDEVGEMPAGMQAKLLRVLQEREVRPLGTEEVVAVDVRLLCATNRHLQDEVAGGRFREDLFYRMAVVELTLPSLRDRVEDIPALARHLLAELSGEMGREAPKLTTGALRRLGRYRWPGNIRQLRNVLSRALVLAEADLLDETVIELPGEADAASRSAEEPRFASRRDFEANEAAAILAALNRHGWNVSEVSRDLGIPRTTLYRKFKKYGLEPR